MSAHGSPAAPAPPPSGSAGSSTSGALGSAAVLTIASMLANAGNYVANVVLGRWLSPAAFADASLMVTLMLVTTAVAVSLQLLVARHVSRAEASGDTADLAAHLAWFARRATLLGVAAGGVLAAGAPLWSQLFHTHSAWIFVVLGAGMPFYVAQSVYRGWLQGKLEMRALAATFVVEMVVRVAATIGLVAAGFGVVGATVALALSFLATWLAARRGVERVPSRPLATGVRAELLSFARPVSILMAAQIVINNSDVLVAKHFLDADTAGVYAAVSLIGRAVFFLSWSVATAVFPVAAREGAGSDGDARLLRGGAALVGGLGLACTAGAGLLGSTVLGKVFGPAYARTGPSLAAYALVTTLFAVANLFATHRLSTGNVVPSKVLLAGAVAQLVLLLAVHGSISSLIAAQFAAMTVTLAAVAVTVFVSPHRPLARVPEGALHP